MDSTRLQAQGMSMSDRQSSSSRGSAAVRKKGFVSGCVELAAKKQILGPEVGSERLSFQLTLIE